MNSFKKIAIIITMLLLLASCGSKPQSPEDILSENQTLMIGSLETLITKSPLKGVSKGNVKFSVDSKEGKGSANIDYNIEFDTKAQSFAGDVKMDLNATMTEASESPIENISGNMSLDLVATKNKFIFKLKTLNLPDIEKDPQFGAFLAMLDPYKEKWYFVNLPESDVTNFTQQDIMKNYKEIIGSIKNYTIFKQTVVNDNKEFYDYNVVVDEENVVKMAEEINKIMNPEKLLTEEKIAEIKSNIKDMNEQLDMNIKINKDNLEYFILTMSDEEGNFTLENTKTNMNISFEEKSEKVSLTFTGIKSKGKLSGKVILKEDTTEMFNGTVSIETDGLKSNFILDGVAKNGSEEMKVKIGATEEVKQKDVTIVEPTDITDLQEAISGFMSSMMGGMQIESGDLDTDIPEIENHKEM